LTRGLPEELSTYLNYCRSLKFEEKPDYIYCRKLFKDVMHKFGHEFDYQFDWVTKKAGAKVNMGDYADAKPDIVGKPPQMPPN